MHSHAVEVEEKHVGVSIITPKSNSLEKRELSSEYFGVPPELRLRPFARWNTKIERLTGLEVRGITRVPLEERYQDSVMGYVHMAILWFGMNVAANNITIGLLGLLVFNLGFLDSAMMSTFGILLGSVGAAYMSIWDPQSGNRTMVCLDSHSDDLPNVSSVTNPG